MFARRAFLAASFAIGLSGCQPPAASCSIDSLSDLYATYLSRNWGETLTHAFVDIDGRRLTELGHPIGAAERERLTEGYGPLVEKFYAKEVWLPGVREYVNKHLAPSEQCEVFSYYQTPLGRKVFEMQVTPGELEFVRQQATNARKANPQFAQERLEMLRSALADLADQL